MMSYEPKCDNYEPDRIEQALTNVAVSFLTIRHNARRHALCSYDHTSTSWMANAAVMVKQNSVSARLNT